MNYIDHSLCRTPEFKSALSFSKHSFPERPRFVLSSGMIYVDIDHRGLLQDNTSPGPSVESTFCHLFITNLILITTCF